MDAYNTCCDALLQLGEAVPQSLTPEETKNMMIATSNIAQSISETGLLEMKDMDEKLTISLKFYSLMADSCFVAKQEIYPFAVCRMVEVSCVFLAIDCHHAYGCSISEVFSSSKSTHSSPCKMAYANIHFWG